MPKLTYFLRTSPFFKMPETLGLYNNQLRNSLETILNIKLDDLAWQQSSLPVAFGGLGIRWATDIALPAFLSSAHGAQGGVKKLLPQEMREPAV